jgi:translocator protein
MNITRSDPRAWLLLPVFLLLSFVAAATGYFFPPGEWYASLHRPSFAPPSWLFGPVWTVLYVLIALAGWLVWRQAGWRSQAMALWLTQLGLNALWTPLFFGLHWLGLALLEMAVLWLVLLACMRAFWRVHPAAGAMLLPYLAWISFAWVLNAGFWWLNR